MLRSPVRVLVVDPIPGTLDFGVGGHGQLSLGGGTIGDLLVEVRHDHRSDAVGAAVAQRGLRRGGEGHLGLIGRLQRGERRNLFGCNATDAATADRQRVGAPVAQRDGGLPHGVVRGHDAVDRFAALVDHVDTRQGPVLGFDHDRRDGVDVTRVGAGGDRYLGRPSGFRGGVALTASAARAVRGRHNVYRTHQGEDHEHRKQEWAGPPAEDPAEALIAGLERHEVAESLLSVARRLQRSARRCRCCR